MFFFRNSTDKQKITLKDEIELGLEDSLETKTDVIASNVVSPFSLTAEGDTLFSVKSSEELLFDNRLLLQRIEELLSAHTDYSDYTLLRSIFHIMVRRLVECVSVAPASQSLHDNDCGGLFRHSLLVLVKCLELYKREKSFSVVEDMFCLMMLSFTHDLGKIFTDYTVYSLNKDKIFEKGRSLSSFIEKENLSHLRFSFREKREHLHESDPFKYQSFFFQDKNVSEAEMLLVKNKISSLEVIKNSGRFNSLLKKADVLACACSVKDGHPFFSIGSYLILGLLSKNISCEKSGAYLLDKGLLVEMNSPEYQHIIEVFDGYNSLLDYYEKLADYEHISFHDEIFDSYKSKFNSVRKSFFKELASFNFFIRHGYMRSCNWYLVSNLYESRLVYGFIINYEHDIDFGFGYSKDIEYRIKEIHSDSDVESLLLKLNPNLDVEKVTSVGVLRNASVADALFDYIDVSACLNPTDISIDTYSDARDLELRTERNLRLRMKREAAKMQNSESLSSKNSKNTEIKNGIFDQKNENTTEIKNGSIDAKDNKNVSNSTLQNEPDISSTDESAEQQPETFDLDSFDDALSDDDIKSEDNVLYDEDELEDYEEEEDECDYEADEDFDEEDCEEDECDYEDEDFDDDDYEDDEDDEDSEEGDDEEEEDDYFEDNELDERYFPNETREERIKRKIEERRYFGDLFRYM